MDLTVIHHGINLELFPAPDSAADRSLLQESTFDELGELKEHMAMLLNTFQACHK